jgi:hypothetical protein
MARSLATISLVTAAFFILAILVLHILAPGLNPMVSGISYYALSDYGFLLSLAVLLIGVAGITLSVALWPAARSTAEKAGLVLLIAWGLSSALAGLFPIDAPGTPPTLSGTIHGLMGMNFLLVVPAILLIELGGSRGTPNRTRTATFWLAWLMLIAAILLFVFNGPLYGLHVGGAIQRLYWVVLTLWLMLKAFQVRRTSVASTTPVTA